MIETGQRVELQPGQFCAYQLQALEAAEGQTRRRKRDQSPDRVGLGIKRDLLERAVVADPAPRDFEGWLLRQIAEADDAGAVRAMCEQIYQEYRMARLQPELAGWLARGAPSDDAVPGGSERRRGPKGDGHKRDRWHGTDDELYGCTCHLPQR